MTGRERMLKALSHQPTDRVPVDLGGTFCSGAHVSVIDKLRQALGLDKPGEPAKVFDPYQMLGMVEADLQEALELDVVSLPGPPDAVLDGGPYTTETIEQDGKVVAVQLTSQQDKRSGIRFSRVIRIYQDSTYISVDATMKNIDTKDRRWGIWSHTQFNAANRHGDGFNTNYRAYCPLNPNSMFPKGYDVIFGLAQNPSFRPDYENKMMQVHYQRRVGKIGLDCDAGWIATVDGTDGYAFVQRFSYEKGREYPDNSSVEFWMNGLGEIFAYNKIIKMPESPQKNPYNFESEMIGPYARLKPGQSSSFHYDWYAAKIGAGLPVSNCSNVGICCKPLSARMSKGKLLLDGHYGVFYKANMQMVFLDENDSEIKKAPAIVAVTPLSPVTSAQISKLAEDTKVPENTEKIAVCIYDSKGQLLGELAGTRILRD